MANYYHTGDFPPGGHWPAPQLIPQPTTYWPMALPSIQQIGCICPAGANKDCESPVCPRKPFPSGAA